jgi:hypothetical protein
MRKILVILIVLLPSCNREEEKAVAFAKEFFKEYSKPSATSEQEWGLHDYRIYKYTDYFFSLGSKEIEIKKLPDSVYTAVLSFNIRGRNFMGGKVVQYRELTLKIQKVKEKFKVLEHKFTLMKPLTFFSQFWDCIKMYLLGMFLTFLFILIYSWNFSGTFVALQVCGLPVLLVAIYVSFGILLAQILFFVVCVLEILFLWLKPSS